MAETKGAGPPRWDLTTLFSGLESRDFTAAQEQLGADLVRLTALYDRHDVRTGKEEVALTPATVLAFDEVVTATNELLDHIRTSFAYLNARLTTDAGDDRAATVLSQVQRYQAGVQKLTNRLEGWVAGLGPDGLISASTVAADHAHALHQAATSAAHHMTESEESLYADLRLTASTAWNKLHGDFTSLLTGVLDGRTVPVTELRGMATDPDPDRRHRAYQAELAAWKSAEVPLAAALNAIKGEANTVNLRRGWPDVLAPALHANSVTRQALEAMQAAAVASFPDFRRFLRAKARLLGGAGGLAWWDMMAPVPGEVGISWQEAAASVADAFASYSSPLADLARRALAERWIDAEPRSGKRGGAFCMSVQGDESRVLLNFDGSLGYVQTLAHELGHAYHNTNLAARTPLQRRTPMALAETASLFCETIMTQAGLAGAHDSRRLALLNVDLTGACQVVVDIHSRFLFERSMSECREKGTVAPAELCRLMADAQDQTYGDGLEPATQHHYMWAVKPHYYSSAFYNWPYCFGLLFGIGLYARYREDPDRFRAGYDDLLSATGLGSAAALAARFGIDLNAPDFWHGSLQVIRARIDDFERLVDAAAPDGAALAGGAGREGHPGAAEQAGPGHPGHDDALAGVEPGHGRGEGLT
jgi:oligoendopeptidase F